MSESENSINVDMNRVVSVLKSRFASRVADLEGDNAMLQVALEDAIKDREEALSDNASLRERLTEAMPGQ